MSVEPALWEAFREDRDELAALRAARAGGMPERCLDCKEFLRPQRESLAEYPGTVRHKGLGRCFTCYERNRKKERTVA
ncbi:hypothetical protein [Tomitella gaofuii]|uniref:hypothetical protein n=1 Tax=Tomitella gaofuii TaxID=2760083 RepID=UPI0015F8A288|nr:hypothetical protein [Tomitella gaofuii]